MSEGKRDLIGFLAVIGGFIFIPWFVNDSITLAFKWQDREIIVYMLVAAFIAGAVCGWKAAGGRLPRQE